MRDLRRQKRCTENTKDMGIIELPRIENFGTEYWSKGRFNSLLLQSFRINEVLLPQHFYGFQAVDEANIQSESGAGGVFQHSHFN